MKFRTSLMMSLSIGLIFTISCGGGSENTALNNDDDPLDVEEKDDSDTETNSGIFIDSPVQGLSYSTNTQSGTTDSDGTFEFLQDEIVEFSIGDFFLGSAVGSDALSPFDLVPDATPITNALDIKELQNNLAKGFYDPIIEVRNMAFLLQGLDLDADPSNGITIPEGLDPLTENIEIDLTTPQASRFRNDRGYRNLLNDGIAENLFTAHPIPPQPGAVLNHLYESLGLIPEIYRLSTHSFDFDANGIPDKINKTFYNDLGLRTRIEQDNNGDGTTDEIIIFTYDENNNFTKFESDYDNDGVYDYTEIIAFDPFGQNIENKVDSDGDGNFDTIVHSEYDKFGNRIFFKVDDGADGTYDSITKFEYDENNNNIVTRYDIDADGTYDNIEYEQYNENNKVVLHEADVGNDGTIDIRRFFTYNTDGQQILLEFDNNADGNIDFIEASFYDDNGNRIKFMRDPNGDGNFAFVEDYEYDEIGNEIRKESWFTASASKTITINEYDENGYLIRSTSEDEFGSILSIVERTYEPGTWFDVF